jgi:hypothetical protein
MLPNLVDSTDIGMVERRPSAGFATEPLQRRWVERHVVRKKFKRDQAAEFCVLGRVDNTHPTTTQLLDDAVARDDLTDHSDGCRQLPISSTWTKVLGCILSSPLSGPCISKIVNERASTPESAKDDIIVGQSIYGVFAENAGLLRF